MATQSDTFQRTEQPTILRLAEAREQGQVARSRDLTSAVVLLAAIAAGWLGGGAMIGELTAMVSRMLTFSPMGPPDTAATSAAWAPVGPVAHIAGWFCGILLAAALLAGIGQVGLRVAAPAVHPRWDRLSPAAGFKRLVSSRGLVRALLALAKIAAVFFIAAVTIRSQLPEIASACGLGMASQAAAAWSMAVRLAWRIVLVLVVLGAVDWMYQWRQHRRELMMTRREVLEDLRKSEGDPLTRSRRRGRRRTKAQANVARKGQDEDRG